MKLRLALVMLASAAAVSVAWSQTPPPATAPATAPAATLPFKTAKENAGYAIGMQFGKRIAGGLKGIDYDPAALVQGLKDAITADKPLMTEEQIIATLDELQKSLEAKAAEEEAKLGAANLKAGEAFLADNAKKEGVKTTPSGLQYKVIKNGPANGKSPKETDTVSVHYKGTLINGKQFDASGDREVSFPLNRVIKGWTEGLQLMKVGDTFQFVIPANLAYGSDPPPGAPIGPNEVLIFEVELLEVK